MPSSHTLKNSLFFNHDASEQRMISQQISCASIDSHPIRSLFASPSNASGERTQTTTAAEETNSGTEKGEGEGGLAEKDMELERKSWQEQEWN